MGGPNRGGRGAGQKASHNHKKKNQKSANSQKSTNSESSDSGNSNNNSRKSSEELPKESDLDIVRQQAREDYVLDEIFQEAERNALKVSDNLNPENASSGFTAAPGDERRSQAKMITKRGHTAKRRRNSLDEDIPISEQIFDGKSIEEQTVIVVNNLSVEIDNIRLSYLKESKAIRGEIKADQTKQANTAVNMANEIETLKATIKELKVESENGKKSAQDLVTAVNTLSTMVKEQNTTIQGLVTGKVDLKDTTDLQHKINEVMKSHLKTLSETVVKHSDRNLGVTQSRCNDIVTVANKIQNELEKSQRFPKERENAGNSNQESIIIDEEISVMTSSTSNYAPLERNSSSGANFDGTHNKEKTATRDSRPEQPLPSKSYANKTKAGLEADLPVGAPPGGQKYNPQAKQNNKATFDRMEAEGPTMVRKDYATFPDGNIKWNVHYEPKKPELTEQQKKRRKNKWDRDREKTDKEVLIFMIPTRDTAGRIQSREYDNAQVKRLFKECARGGYWLKAGDIVGTIRQIQNDRHPTHLPITVTCKDKETAESVLTAASNIFINGSRKARPDDEERGRFGFFRPSLSEQERRAIKEKHKQKDTPHGRGQVEIRQRKYESHTGADEWADLITDDYDGEDEQNAIWHTAVNGGPPPMDTSVPSAPRIEDENLNMIPKESTAPPQNTQETENEKLKKQLEVMTKQAELMSQQNNQYRQRNATLEELNKKKA